MTETRGGFTLVKLERVRDLQFFAEPDDALALEEVEVVDC